LRLTAIVDSSSLIILFKTSLLDKCIDLYSLSITKTVKSEITRKGYPGWDYFSDLCKRKIINLLPEINLSSIEDGLSRVDRGERNTILQFIDGKGDFIIIDDGRGAAYCLKQSLPYINALLVPKILLFKNIISVPEFRDYFSRIIAVGRYSAAVIDFAENCGIDDLKKFIS
jgi:hypothetical protein